ncbi:TPA: hypothetical protein ACG5W6_003324, partial [Escherichia coli]
VSLPVISVEIVLFNKGSSLICDEPQNTIIWIADKVVVVHAVSGTVASLKSSPLLAITFLYHQNDLSEKSTQMWTGNDKIFIRKRILSALLR